MKAVCIETYFDEKLHRTVGKGETVNLSQKRFEELSTESNKGKKPLVKAAEPEKKQGGKKEEKG